MAHAFDPGKLAELMLYVSAKSQEDQRFGATKLNKLLFYAEFMMFAKYGRPITGATYQRLDHGPAPRELPPIRRELTESRAAVIVPRDYFGLPQHALVPLREPNLALFAGEEIAMVDWVIEKCWHETAASLSAATHRLPGWIFANEGEDIPYSAVFLSKHPLTPHEVTRGEDVAKLLGLQIS